MAPPESKPPPPHNSFEMIRSMDTTTAATPLPFIIAWLHFAGKRLARPTIELWTTASAAPATQSKGQLEPPNVPTQDNKRSVTQKPMLVDSRNSKMGTVSSTTWKMWVSWELGELYTITKKDKTFASLGHTSVTQCSKPVDCTIKMMNPGTIRTEKDAREP